MIKKTNTVILLISLALSIFSFGQDSNTHLILKLSPNSELENLKEVEISFSINNNVKKLDLTIDKPLKLSETISDSELFLSLSVEAVNLPDTYTFNLMNLKIPYTQIGKSNTIIINPTVLPENLGSASRKIWSTNVKDLSLEKKFEFFQLTSEIFQKREELLAENWPNLNNKDVQVAFKYLEVVRELSKEHLTSSSEIENAISWLNMAISNNRYRVGKALGGIESAKQIISQVKSIIGNEFARLYKYTNNLIDNSKKYQQLKLIVKHHESLPSKELRQRVLRVSKISESSMINDLAAAFNESSLKNSLDKLTFSNEITFLISKIDYVLQIEPKNKLKNVLIKSREFFINLKSYRNNNDS